MKYEGDQVLAADGPEYEDAANEALEKENSTEALVFALLAIAAELEEIDQTLHKMLGEEA